MRALQMRTAAVFVAAGLFLGGCATPPPMDPASAVFRTGSMEEMARLMREAQAQAQAQPQAEQRAGCEAQAQQRLSERQRAEPDQVDADLLNEAIAGCRKAGDRNGERLLLEWLGHMHFMQSQYAAAAETYRRVFPLADELFDKVSAWEALGRAQLAAGDFAQALLSYRTAFDVAASAPEPDTWLQVQALRGQGLVHLAQRDYAQASRVLERAFALTKEEGDDRTLAGPLLSSLGFAQLRAGQTQAAEASLRQALEVPESTSAELRRAQAQMPAIPPALQPLLAAMRPMLQDWMPHATALMVDGYACSLLQDLLVAQQRHGEALETSERCRGRALVQRLAVRALPEEAQAPTLVQLRAIARAQKATIVEYTVVYEPALLPDWIPDRESALLVYVVAPEGTVTARRVPLEGALAGGKLTLASLIDVSRTVIGVRGRGGTASEPAAGATAAPTASGEPAPRRLHRLLIEPIVDLLPRDADARVIFVPQESLFLVPFAALQDAEGRYVVDHHTISLSPSIHTLAFTQRQRVARHSAAPAQGARALIVGNPAMPSYPPAPGLAPQPLEDLPDAEVEAKTIAQLLQSEPLIGKQATKVAFTARLEQAQVVHLATHGLLDDVSQSRPKMPFARHAALSSLFKPGTVQFRAPGSLALAPDAQDSGLLTADEIAQLRTNANLVVMSACDTGRGTIVGDGVIGLTRSWVAAGVPSVVASLWAVPDEPTSTLMLAFHQNLQQRRDKASALRQAMLQVRARYPVPMAWAAFVLFGEAE